MQESTNGALSQSPSIFTWGERSPAQAAQSSSGSSTCRVPCTHDLGTAMQALPYQCHADTAVLMPCKHRRISAMQTSPHQCHASIIIPVLCKHCHISAMQTSPHQRNASIAVSVPCKHLHTSAMQALPYQCLCVSMTTHLRLGSCPPGVSSLLPGVCRALTRIHGADVAHRMRRPLCNSAGGWRAGGWASRTGCCMMWAGADPCRHPGYHVSWCNALQPPWTLLQHNACLSR